MTAPRRRVLRPAPPAPSIDPRRQQQLQKRRAQLETERASLDRWMSRLRRAFNAVERQRVKISRIERTLRGLEQP